MELAVIGLGKLGLPLAALQARHHRVYGIDTDKRIVTAVTHGECLIREPGLPHLLRVVRQSGNLSAHTDYLHVKNTDFSLIIVPTPSDETGAFTSKYVLEAVEKIGRAVARQRNRHVVVVCSTVMPGQCDGPIRAALEKASGKTVGDDIGLVYSPEFIALGSVIRDMEFPSMTLIGESDAESGRAYEELMRHITDAPVCHMSLTSAEIAKIAVNGFVTMKISYANVLGEICERYPNANAGQVTAAIGLDYRIGTPYIKPGGPYGGPCFPRDSRALALIGEQVGVSMPLARSTDTINERQVQRIADRVESMGRSRVGILGMSYKPGTPVTEESFGIKLAKELHRRGLSIKVYDPIVFPQATDLPISISWTLDETHCFGNEMTTVVALPHPDIIGLFPQIFSHEARLQSLVLDCWNCIPESPWDLTNIVRLGTYADS